MHTSTLSTDRKDGIRLYPILGAPLGRDEPRSECNNTYVTLIRSIKLQQFY